jgi:hypothetical protein
MGGGPEPGLGIGKHDLKKYHIGMAVWLISC